MHMLWIFLSEKEGKCHAHNMVLVPLRKVISRSTLASLLFVVAFVPAERMQPGVTPDRERVTVDVTVERWHPPLGPPLRVTQPFQRPATPYSAGHRGIDLPISEGQSVYSPTSGVVTFVGKVVDRTVVSIRVDERTVVSMEPVETGQLNEGDSVGRAQHIGTVSTGGHCESSCVHLGVRVDDEYVNPMRYFVGKPVLLPW